MNRLNFTKINLAAAIIASIGSIIAFMTFYFWERRIDIIEQWNLIEPLMYVILTIAFAIFSYFTSLNLKMRERTVFLVYSHKDRQAAAVVCEKLKYLGIKVLTDELVLKIGDNISDTLQKNIYNSDKIIILLSKNTENSDWVKAEIEFAKSLKKLILPAMIEISELPELLHGIKYADLTVINEKSIEPIVKAIRN